MIEEPNTDEIASQTFDPGWEREESTDYLDALLDPTDPLHAAAVGIGSEKDPSSGESDDPDEHWESVKPLPNERPKSNNDSSN